MNRVSILITGIGGFIGNSLEVYIKEKYPLWNVYGIDKKTNKMKRRFRIDIQDKGKLKNILLNIRPLYIFHLAGTTVSSDFKKLCKLNVHTTYTLLNTIKEIDDYNPRIIIPSSASEYGDVPKSRMPIKESFSLNPISIYGFTKMMQTKLSLMFVKKGMDIVIARIFNILGKGTPVNFSMGRFAYELALIKKNKKRPLIYTKNLDSRRDFLDIRDVCRFIISVARYGKRGEVYNICRGRPYKVRYLLNRFINIAGIKDIDIIERKDKDLNSDISDSFGFTGKLRKIEKNLKFIPIEKSLKDTYFYYLSRV